MMCRRACRTRGYDEGVKYAAAVTVAVAEVLVLAVGLEDAKGQAEAGEAGA